jgi:hypothetical protein
MQNGIGMHTAEGALGGALGTLAIMQALRLSHRLPLKLQPAMPRRDPGDFMVSKVEQMRHKPLPRSVHDGLATALHWAYGIGWGAALGMAAGREPLGAGRVLSMGAGMGALNWAAGYIGWLPATKLLPPVHRQGMGHVASSLISHVGYGMLASLPILIADRMVAREPWYTRWVRSFR